MFDRKAGRGHGHDRYERDLADAVPLAPGRSPVTARLPASAHAIAQVVAEQLRGAAPAAQVQAKGDLDGPDVHATAAQGLTGTAATLPFIDQIQRAFGHHDVSEIRAHIGGPAAAAAAAMNARAYAAGDAVAFASTPDLHTAAHEAAHVVQQRGGVRLAGGIGRAGDEYERHADEVADAVVRGDTAEALLDRYAHRGASGGPAVQKQEREGARRGDSDSQQLVERARELDAQLMSGELPQAQRVQIARQLIQIYETLQHRIDRGEFQPHGSGDRSPLAGLLDDLPPFGNLDMWIALSGQPRRARRGRRAEPQPQQAPEPSAEPTPDTGGDAPRPTPSPDPGSTGGLDRSDVRPENVAPSTAGAAIDRASLALDIIGALVGGFLFEAAGAVIGPVLGMASHVIALEQGVENHERAGRSLGVRATLKYTMFTHPAPRTIVVDAVFSFYTNDPDLQRERNSLTATGISAGDRIDVAIREGMTRAASSVNSAVGQCEAELRRRLTAAGQGEPTQQELQQLRRGVYQAIYDRVGQDQGSGRGR